MWNCLIVIALLLLSGTNSPHVNNQSSHFLSFAGAATIPTCVFPPSQLSALQDLYDSTDGRHWKYKLSSGNHWNFSEPNPNPCEDQWAGITCTPAPLIPNLPCNVTKLRLNDFAMIGRLPHTLNQLSTLQELDLSENYLFGYLPQTLTELSQLTFLTLSANLFNDTIPFTIGQMKSLMVLDLTSNMLQGEFPPSMSELHNLVYMNISVNNITDHIPSFFGTNLTNLEVLDLSENNIFGSIPPSLGRLTRLVTLKVNKNNLYGVLPSSLGDGGLRVIQKMDFTNNSITGTLPFSYANLVTLTFFSVGNNRMEGLVPDSLVAQWKRLKVFNINNNRFNGTLPAVLGNMTDMTELSFSTNSFTGPLPIEWTRLSNLQLLYLSNNLLSGTLPDTVPSWGRVIELEVYNNNFTGSLPSLWFSNLSAVDVLDFGANGFAGSLPDSLCVLPKIRFLLLNRNHFTGSIPACIGQVNTLIDLLFQSNDMEGSLPANITELRALRYFYVYGNRFTGTLPANFGETFYFMSQLDMHDNLFTGTIPSSTCHMVEFMYYLFLSQNLFHGSIPSCLGQARYMLQLFLQYNTLTGSLPSSFSNFTQIDALLLESNALTGTVGKEIYGMGHFMRGFLLANNFFHGTIPPNIGVMTTLTVFNMSNNSFSGTLPSTMSRLGFMASLDLSNNMFTGSIASGVLSTFPYLHVFFVNNNGFTGPLSNLFNASLQTQFTDIDVSSNAFTGTLPSDLFAANRGLTTFAAVKNCITGSIPATMCECKAARAFALDGLHTSGHCQDRIFPLIKSIDTYQLTEDLSGSIPDCLYSMPLLKTLHLSGNGISGSLSSSLALSHELTDLSLSHNLLKGPVPHGIQSHSFVNLDLSFNQMSGGLEDVLFANVSSSYEYDNMTLQSYVGTSLALQVNRLSGAIPTSILHIPTVSVLQGNIFSCIHGDDSLPSHDQYTASYVCGSDSVNAALYAWLVAIGLVILLVILWQSYMRRYRLPALRSLSDNITDWWAVYSDPAVLYTQSDALIRQSSAKWRSSAFPGAINGTDQTVVAAAPPRSSMFQHATSIVRSSLFNTSGLNMTMKSKTKDGKVNYIFRFGLLLGRTRKITVHILAMMLLVIMPSYIALNSFYAMYAYPYAWQLGLAFISGTVPAVFLLCLLILFYCRIYYFLKLWLLDSYVEAVLIGRVKKTLPEPAGPVAGGEDDDSRMRTISTASVTFFSSLARKLTRRTTQTVSENEGRDGVFKGQLLKKQKLEQEITQSLPWFRLRQCGILIVNCTCVLAVNMLYVYATTLSISKDALHACVFLVSMFKILWGNLIVVRIFATFLLRPYEKRNEIDKDGIDTHQELLDHFTASCLRFLVYLSIFNNVIAPSLAAMIVSPSCFFYMIADSPSVSVSYQFVQCVEFYSTTVFDGCSEYAYNTHTTSYSPPYAYTYQCSSALMTSFSDIFVYRYLVSGLILPLILISVKSLQEYCYRHFTDNTNSVYRHLFALCSRLLPVIARPVSSPAPTISSDNSDVGRDTELAAPSISDDVSVSNPLNRSFQHSAVTQSTASVDSHPSNDRASRQPFQRPVSQTFSSSTSQLPVVGGMRSTAVPVTLYRETIAVDRLVEGDKQERKKLFNKEIFAVGFVGDLAVLMTFGSIFPPLALVIFVNMIVNTFLTQLMIGRFVFLSKSIDQNYLAPLVDFLNEECKDVGRLIFDSIPTIAFLATAFWSFALFDTLGDSVGTKQALWILIFMAFMPLWIYGIEHAWYSLRELYARVLMEFNHSVGHAGSSMFRASGFTDADAGANGSMASGRHSIFARSSLAANMAIGRKSVKASMGDMPEEDGDGAEMTGISVPTASNITPIRE